jgi:hypothetical protein
VNKAAWPIMTAADVINLVSALVWPVIVVLLVLVFRDPIKSLLGRLKSFETPGFKGAFNEPAEEALGKAEAIAVPRAHDQATQALINQTASQPWWAVHQAWRSARWAAERATPDLKGPSITTADRVHRLREEGLVDDQVVQLTLTLRGLYYDMKGEPDALTSTAAADFVEAASTLAQALRETSSGTSASPASGDGAKPSWPAVEPPGAAP